MNESTMVGAYPRLSAALMFSGADEALITAAMPETGKELVGVIGFMPTIRLLAQLGGKRVFIQRTPAEDSRIVKAIGMELAEALGGHRGGHHMELPRLTSAERMLRDNALRADFDAGVPMDAIVDRYGITQRHARKILKASASVSPRAAPFTKPRCAFTADLFDHMTRMMAPATAAQTGAHA
jgi:Mor family transcriptional regulator